MRLHLVHGGDDVVCEDEVKQAVGQEVADADGTNLSGFVKFLHRVPCAVVIAVDLSEEKLQIAKELGATYGINSKEENVVEKVMEYTDGFGADCVIEAVGSPVTYVTAIDAVSFTGRVVCIGYAKSAVEFQTKYFVQKELDIRGSRNANPSDFRAVQRYLAKADVPMDRFVSAVSTPEPAIDAMKKWAEAPAQVFRILVKF